MDSHKKVAVFVLLGQSNAVGHDVPMDEVDMIREPLKNVFGLKRSDNQSFDIKNIVWSGYTSGGMNLAEDQDDTYSVANCLAKYWQAEIDNGNENNLPDLYIVHIAIGAQGVSKNCMWYPEREKILIPGKIGEVNISLYPFTVHIMSMLNDSFDKLGVTAEYVGVHWRGGEQEYSPTTGNIDNLKSIYETIFGGIMKAADCKMPIVLHKLVCRDRCAEEELFKRMTYINNVFEQLCAEQENISIFDTTRAPHFIEDVVGNGLFKADKVHYTAETNKWVAEEILNDYKKRQLIF